MKTLSLVFALAVLVLAGTRAAAAQTRSADPQLGSQHLEALPLVNRADLSYLGYFRVPNQDGEGNSLGYGGHALSTHPAENALFFGGHDWDQQLCEIGIPAVINTSQVATIVQNCTDITEDRLAEVDEGSIKLGGTLLADGRLIVSAYSDYDADGSQQRSHFTTTPDLTASGDIGGPYQVGDWAGIVSGYMAAIPPEWQAVLGGPTLTGNCCLSIISRTSYGPAVSVFNPADLGRHDPVPTIPLLFYPADHPMDNWDATSPYFNGTTQIVGVAFPPGSRSVLFIGRHGIGDFCYGSGEACSDPVNPYQGTHAYPYVHQVWAYDALELQAVKDGVREPWEVFPYAIWRLNEIDDSGGASISGAAFDPTSGRLFVTENYGEKPAVHVYQITTNTATLLPHNQYLPRVSLR